MFYFIDDHLKMMKEHIRLFVVFGIEISIFCSSYRVSGRFRTGKYKVNIFFKLSATIFKHGIFSLSTDFRYDGCHFGGSRFLSVEVFFKFFFGEQAVERGEHRIRRQVFRQAQII